MDRQDKTARADTKRGYGLCAGILLHPGDKDAVLAALESGEPITDNMGLGVRYVHVWPENGTPHFRIHEKDRPAAINRAGATAHDQVVRVVYDALMAGGEEALRLLCQKIDIPSERFDVASVETESRQYVGGQAYQPDITVHLTDARFPRIELEVVYTHDPERKRLELAREKDAVVLVCNIRSVIEKRILNPSTYFEMTDREWLKLVQKQKFRAPREASEQSAALIRWRDINQADYLLSFVPLLNAEVDKADALLNRCSNRVGLDCSDYNLSLIAGRDDAPHIYRTSCDLLDEYENATRTPDVVADALSRLLAAVEDFEFVQEDLDRAEKQMRSASCQRWVSAQLSEIANYLRNAGSAPRMITCRTAMWHLRSLTRAGSVQDGIAQKSSFLLTEIARIEDEATRNICADMVEHFVDRWIESITRAAREEGADSE